MSEENRFFVSIKTLEKVAFARLFKYDIDIFRHTTKFDEREFTIDGALTLEQISLLVRDGYKVVVKKHHPKKGLPSSQILSFVERIEGNSDEQKDEKNERSNPGCVFFPPNGYYDTASIALILWVLSIKYPSICKLYNLKELSCQGKPIKYIKIASGGGTNRKGILFIGGVHGRELVNPDLLASFACDLCEAYTHGTGLQYGAKSFEASIVKQIIGSLDIFIVPLVNPDGRDYALYSNDLWKKNRNPNPGLPCMGVDINRNFDFLWSSGVYSSPYSCESEFKGNNAFSEPETRNVRELLDDNPNIKYLIDVHSYSEIVGYSWAIDTNQSSDPSMNFRNPLYDGLRGLISIPPTVDTYSEFIPGGDWSRIKSIAESVRDVITMVRGRRYKAIQSAMVYDEVFNIPKGVSATSQDYAYSRHFVDPTKSKVFAFTLETGQWFNPVNQDDTPPDYQIPNEKPNIIKEVSAGLVKFCQWAMSVDCVVEETVRGTNMFDDLVNMRRFRDEELLNTKAGTAYVTILEENVDEILDIVKDDKNIHSQTVNIIERLNKVVKSSSVSSTKEKTSSSELLIDEDLVKDIDHLLQLFKKKASTSLRNAIEQASTELNHFCNKTIREGLEAASKNHSKFSD